MIGCEQTNKFICLVGPSPALGKETQPQTARNLLLKNMIDPDYENIRAILKSTKRNALLAEYSQEMKEWEDDLEHSVSQPRK